MIEEEERCASQAIRRSLAKLQTRHHLLVLLGHCMLQHIGTYKSAAPAAPHVELGRGMAEQFGARGACQLCAVTRATLADNVK